MTAPSTGVREHMPHKYHCKTKGATGWVLGEGAAKWGCQIDPPPRARPHPIQSVSPSRTPSLEKSRYLVPTSCLSVALGPSLPSLEFPPACQHFYPGPPGSPHLTLSTSCCRPLSRTAPTVAPAKQGQSPGAVSICWGFSRCSVVDSAHDHTHCLRSLPPVSLVSQRRRSQGILLTEAQRILTLAPATFCNPCLSWHSLPGAKADA